jgi:hypothetical protein
VLLPDLQLRHVLSLMQIIPSSRRSVPHCTRPFDHIDDGLMHLRQVVPAAHGVPSALLLVSVPHL